MSIVFSPSVYAVLREAGARRGAFGPGASAGNQNKQGSSHLVARHVLPSRLPGSKRPARSAHNSRSPKSLPYKLSYNKSTPDSQVLHPHINMPKEKVTRGKGRATKADGGKKKKDPNAPKRGLSAYMFFANEQRDKVREDNPGIKFGEVGKMLGEKWKALNEKQRTPYEAKAAADKKRYEEEKAAYQAGEEEEEESE
ncbi:hypothetical protein HBH56_046970 [Parastagonospora nodorum]|nr:hypothetical protein HBH56_046970 [Parastagonospora nodorum]KAH3933272.1 hypothetical protein HBH54_074710 [Parastagonospora nodorum]KAH3946263.1 hypothetical protein HBH53_133850 [Parastagonospora nodorum]KAH3972953.1 hypothetical protein HBH52_146770 [Parastagonospora nodorum]KAH3980871.1 hypothetical protein HBH51_052700 [Parastagonospora nodorum]